IGTDPIQIEREPVVTDGHEREDPRREGVVPRLRPPCLGKRLVETKRPRIAPTTVPHDRHRPRSRQEPSVARRQTNVVTLLPCLDGRAFHGATDSYAAPIWVVALLQETLEAAQSLAGRLLLGMRGLPAKPFLVGIGAELLLQPVNPVVGRGQRSS